MGTLNHLIVGDIIWLKRFPQEDRHCQHLQAVEQFIMPNALNQIISTDLNLLLDTRQILVGVILSWISHLSEPDLDGTLNYTNTQGVRSTKATFDVLIHFFNHQTHHRGQLSTLLFQAGVNIGITDFIAFIPNQGLDVKMVNLEFSPVSCSKLH